MRWLAASFQGFISAICFVLAVSFVFLSFLALIGILLAIHDPRSVMELFALAGGSAFFAIFLVRASVCSVRQSRESTNGTLGRAYFFELSRNCVLGGLALAVLIFFVIIAHHQRQTVDERARLSEAQTMADQINRSQDRYFSRHGDYVKTNGDLAKLDIQFAGPPLDYGMRWFNLAVAGADCGKDHPGYRLSFRRQTKLSGVSSRYGDYTMTYDRCADRQSFGDCKKCESDLDDSRLSALP